MVNLKWPFHLTVNQGCVMPIFGKQFLVRTSFHDRPFV